VKIFWNLRWFFKLRWKHYCGSILLFMLISAMQLVTPKAVGHIVDGIVANTMSTTEMLQGSWHQRRKKCRRDRG